MIPRLSDAEYPVSDRLLRDLVLRNARAITGCGDRDLVSYNALRVGTHKLRSPALSSLVQRPSILLVMDGETCYDTVVKNTLSHDWIWATTLWARLDMHLCM